MTRLPSDSCLPSDPSPSVMSPLILPGAMHYFCQSACPPFTSTQNPLPDHYSQPDINTCDPPQAQPPNFLSPHLTPIPSHAKHQLHVQHQSQQRAASLSPTRTPLDRNNGKMNRTRQVDFDPRVSAASGFNVPVDTISGTGSGLITVRRPAVRSIPTEGSSVESQSLSLEARMRQAWDDERKTLQMNRDRAEEIYRATIETLQREQSLEQSRWEAERYRLQAQITQLQSRLGQVEALWNGCSESKSVAFQHQHSLSPQGSLLGQPDLRPATACETNPADQLTAIDQEPPSKVIDVQEYHSELEGIHLKENALKKETFTDTPSSTGSKMSSGKVSPPQYAEERRESARQLTIRAMNADPSSRLTINAGHTPTVSLSMTSTGVSNTAASSGSNTPTLISGDGALSADGDDHSRESIEPAETAPAYHDDDHTPAILEPSDEESQIKGPLTLRNLPAQDEIFLRKLSDKLEKVTTGEDATPTVLKDPEPTNYEDDMSESSVQTSTADNDAESAEEDIPLKIRKTSNFGKPLGSL